MRCIELRTIHHEEIVGQEVRDSVLSVLSLRRARDILKVRVSVLSVLSLRRAWTPYLVICWNCSIDIFQRRLRTWLQRKLTASS